MKDYFESISSYGRCKKALIIAIMIGALENLSNNAENSLTMRVERLENTELLGTARDALEDARKEGHVAVFLW